MDQPSLRTSPYELDRTDRELIAILRRRPRVSGAELARLAGVARNTVQLRLKRLEERGVIVGHGPDIEPRAAGYAVLAFVSLTIAQGAHETVVDHLRTIDEVLEIHTTTGHGDLLLKVVARTNGHLNDLIQRIAKITEVERTETQLALETSLHRTVADLIASQNDDRSR